MIAGTVGATLSTMELDKLKEHVQKLETMVKSYNLQTMVAKCR